MAAFKPFSGFFVLSVFLLFAFNPTDGQGQLEVGFYKKTCPQAEAIIKNVTDYVMKVAPTLGAPLMRMHFHDCFVRGCEGSILLSSPTNQAEKDAIPNQSLRGFQVIDNAKVELEKACPGVVSCADTVAIVARDVTLGAERWEVETGRRDGRVSNITQASNEVLSPFLNITQLISGFQKKGLSVKDLVVLSGGHTVGTSHCFSFGSRMYNFTGKGDTDPSMDRKYIPYMKKKCNATDVTTLVALDPGSFKTFDTNYYTLVAKRRGLLHSDAALLDNPETRAYVIQATTHKSTFFKDFGVSMVRMGRIGVLTGSAGEIRRVCSKVN
ncbi:peroxidase 27 [Tripterygium wilfordii]|uniref:Peroxidase n=1 Tax=Tripterygium wilfordii TaxID=458696 RepID=A0A7J7C377_TRIWF|nr:peroxidase 27 [Tripterygium wilfordii]